MNFSNTGVSSRRLIYMTRASQNGKKTLKAEQIDTFGQVKKDLKKLMCDSEVRQMT